MAENENKLDAYVMDKLSSIENRSLFETMSGMTIEEFAEKYPEVARQIASGVQCSDKITVRSPYINGDMCLKTSYNDGKITVSFINASNTKLPTVKEAMDTKMYFRGQEIPAEIKKALFETIRWTRANGDHLPGRANANGGYLTVTHYESVVNEETGKSERRPIRNEQGKVKTTDYLLGIAPNGEIIGDKKSFVYGRFFEQKVGEGGELVYTPNGDPMYDITRLNNNSFARKVYGVELSISQCVDLAAGRYVVVNGCKNNEGKEFACIVQYNPGNPNNKLTVAHPVDIPLSLRESMGINWGSPADNAKKDEATSEEQEQKRTKGKKASTAKKTTKGVAKTM